MSFRVSIQISGKDFPISTLVLSWRGGRRAGGRESPSPVEIEIYLYIYMGRNSFFLTFQYLQLVLPKAIKAGGGVVGGGVGGFKGSIW